MPVGFESIGDTGRYQVDSNFKNLALIRSGQLLSQQYTNGSTTNTRPTRVAITLNEGEILALACTELCALGSKIGNTVYVYVDSAAGQMVEYYIFKPGGNTSSTFGLQVFSEDGELTFDSGWDLFDVRYILSGYVTASLSAGRKYAFVHSQIGTSITYTQVVNGIPPNSLTSHVRRTMFSAVKISGNSVVCQLSNVDVAATPPSSGAGQPYSETYSNNATPVALIIDVTGF